MSSITTQLKEKIQKLIKDLLPDNINNVCIVDPPDHSNVGDSAIFIGEMDFLRNNYPRLPIFFCDIRNYSEYFDKYLKDTSILLFHGGGNFGDIWPRAHEFRNYIMDKFPDIPKIQFPQSIFFHRKETLERTKYVISKQKSYTLLVRDHTSFQFAKENFDCQVYLCPDMAFSLRKLYRKTPTVDYLSILRTDKEVSLKKEELIKEMLLASSFSFEIEDWINQEGGLIYDLNKKMARLLKYKPYTIPSMQGLSLRLREMYAWQRINYGVNLLSKGKRVITDRLHGHILSTLLGIEHYVYDSFDGKISSFHDTWLAECTTSKFLTTTEELNELLGKRDIINNKTLINKEVYGCE